MEDDAQPQETFKVPATPNTRRQSANTSSAPKHRLSTATKKRAKSRSKTRPKPSSASRGGTNSSLDTSQIPTSASAPELKNDALDDDLKEILAELDGIEQRVTTVLQNLQKEMASCANYMLDSIMAGITSNVDAVKTKVPNVHKLRQANRLVKTQFNTLDEVEDN